MVNFDGFEAAFSGDYISYFLDVKQHQKSCLV
jgi:hypothetical protein